MNPNQGAVHVDSKDKQSVTKRWADWCSDPGDGALHLLLRLFFIILLFYYLDHALMITGKMPSSNYNESVIYLSFLQELFAGWRGLLLTPILGMGIYFRKRLGIPWTTFTQGKSIRFFVSFAAALLAWNYATNDYNLFFDQAYHADRLLLVLMLPLIIWRPIFVLPFLTITIPVIAQFDVLAGHSWAVPYLPLRVLILFFAFFMFHLITRRVGSDDFIFMVVCLIAAHYWLSGWGKLNWAWISSDQIHFLMPATYANGWLSFLEPDKMSSIAQNIGKFDVAARFYTIVVEFGALLILWKRKSIRFFLVAWILFHIGVFFVSGICFWMWAALEAGLLFLFLRKDGIALSRIFDKSHLLISLILIGGGNVWCRIIKLSWHDSPVSYTYRFVASMEGGGTVQLTPNFFAPYDYQFTLSSFGYLTSNRRLPIVWGATGSEISRLLTEANSSDQIIEFEKSHGIIKYDAMKAKQLDIFMNQYIGHWNARQSKDSWFSGIQAPRQLWTFPREPLFDSTYSIHQITVFEVLSFFNNGEYSEIRNVPVHEIEIF